MSDQFVGEIRIFGTNFAPTGWAFCDGQLLSISQNTALFSLLGTTYGGDGKSTFALPDLQGRAPMHPSQGPGLSLHDLGEVGGSETVTLLESEIPAHAHVLRATNDPGSAAAPNLGSGGLAATGRGRPEAYVAAPFGTTVAMGPAVAGHTGGDMPHNNMQPYLTMNFCIALQGIFPARP